MTATHVATLHTSAGDIKVDLYGNHAPKTVKNFLDLASGAREWTDPKTGEKSNANLYDGTIFHRVIDNFMIQGGDPVGQGTGGPGYTFDDEIHPELVFDRPYLFAMANAGLRRDPITGKPAGTNGSQFFITTTATGWLNGKHTIFGEVVDGDSRAVVDSIGKTRTGAADRPVTDITINSITVEDA